VIGLLAAGQGNKDHVFPASLLNLPGGDEPPGVAQQDDLQENLGVISPAARFIVAVFLLKTRCVQPGIYQGMDGELQGSRQQLIFQRHWQKHPLPIVIHLELGHIALCWVSCQPSTK
jgi:hypothetical protein